MKVIGIDQSYTGFGYSTDGMSFKRAFTSAKYKDSRVRRLSAIREWFTGWLEGQGEVSLVTMEGYANAAKFGREMAGELGGVVKLAVFDVLGLEPIIVPPTTLKKFVTGSGGAKKNQMLLGVYKKWGQAFSDDNQADAFALEMFGHAYLDIGIGTGAYHKYEIEAVEAVRKAK